METCGSGAGSSTDTRVPEMIEDPASGIAVVGIRSQEPVMWGEVSLETVAETTWEKDICGLEGVKRRRGKLVFILGEFEARGMGEMSERTAGPIYSSGETSDTLAEPS